MPVFFTSNTMNFLFDKDRSVEIGPRSSLTTDGLMPQGSLEVPLARCAQYLKSPDGAAAHT